MGHNGNQDGGVNDNLHEAVPLLTNVVQLYKKYTTGLYAAQGEVIAGSVIQQFALLPVSSLRTLPLAAWASCH